MKNNKLYLLLPIRCIVFVLSFVSIFAFTHKTPDEISNLWSIVASVVNIFTILLLVIAAKKNGMTYATLINYKRRSVSAGKIIVVIILSVIIGMGGMYLSGLICYGSIMPAMSLKMIAPVPKVLAIINLLVLPVSTALAEDGLYLGAGTGQMKNTVLAVVIPAFFFALQHCFIPTLWDVRYMVYRFLSFLPASIAFCIYYRKKREPLPIMAGHALLDFATAMSIFATSVIPGVYDQMLSM